MTALDWEGDDVGRPPDLKGPHARAWRIDIDRAYEIAGKARDEGADIAAWLIEAPWAHPVWHSYLLHLFHLRGSTQMKEPVIRLAGATHEIVLLAIDPTRPRRESIDTGQFYWLRPANFGAQLIYASDAMAIQDIEGRAVWPILRGELSPDTDFRSVWIELFNDSLVIK